VAVELPGSSKNALEIILGTERLREMLPTDLRSVASAEELLRLIKSGKDADLQDELASAFEAIAASMEKTPVEIVPVITGPTEDDTWLPLRETLINSLRQHNRAAFHFQITDALPNNCSFTRIVWLVPDWTAPVAPDHPAGPALQLWNKASALASVVLAAPVPLPVNFKDFLRKAGLPAQTQVLAVNPRAPETVERLTRALERHFEGHREGGAPINDAATRHRKDHLGIESDADAFAHMITDKTLSPPLAIAIFGNWGSGKSFFMERIGQRISERTARKEVMGGPAPLITRTIWFNAWHYIESDLWASLAATIFDCLNQADGSGRADKEEKRQEIVSQMKISKLVRLPRFSGHRHPR
jgi:hypothetical protein